jgi:hypothetical protein
MITFDANRGAPLTASQRIKEPYPHRAVYRDDYVQIKERKPIGTIRYICIPEIINKSMQTKHD